MTVSKRTLVMCMLIACLGFAANAVAQGPDASLPRTMRPVIRGRQAAVSSMKAEATEAARRILQTGGNAFDAVVGGQAALAVTDFALNGIRLERRPSPSGPYLSPVDFFTAPSLFPSVLLGPSARETL